MTKLQFRILYREFLFRMVDLELLSTSAQGDVSKLLGQFAALLIFISVCLALAGLGFGDIRLPPQVRLMATWGAEHFLIATTMLVVGLFAVLSWDGTFPDRRDVLVLAPLPIRARTLFLAKVAAVATALSLTVLSLHVLAGLTWPLAFHALATAQTVPAFTSDPAIAPVDAASLQSVLNRDLAQAIKPGTGAGLAIGVWQRGVRGVFTYGAAQPDSIFEIGSITKTFTGLVLAQMVAQGKVRLDEPVRELLPEGTVRKPKRNEITLLDLATQQSGLPPMPANIHPADEANPYADYRTADLYEFMSRHGVAKPANTGFLYSNLGFGLLGQALANRAGTTYPNLAGEIAAQLGMRDTVVSLSPEQQRRFIQGHDGEHRQPVHAWDLDGLAGAGAIRSTAGDMLTYLEANLHPEKLGPANTLSTALLKSHELKADAGTGRIALAWFYHPKTGTYWHNGATAGYTGDACFNPKRDYAVIVLSNTGGGTEISAGVIGEHIRSRLTGKPAISPASVSIPASGGVVGLMRMFAVYWITMLAAGAFIFCSVLGLQGLAAQLLPRRLFLRVSSFLQLAAFCLFVSVYFLQPMVAGPAALIAAQSNGLIAWSPSYWFLGFFQALNGSPALAPLAQRAWIGLTVAGCATALSYVLSYFRTLRKIVEEPDIAPAFRGASWLPRFGNGLQTAVVQFSVRTLFRSRKHRMILAFYVGIGLALVIFFMKTPRAEEQLMGDKTPLLFSSLVLMCVWVLGTRVVFSMPLDLGANWIFRITEIQGAPLYLAAIRRPLFVLAVGPVWLASAVLFLSIWPWRLAAEHLAVLGLWGMLLAYLGLNGFHKIPFTCSYLPGKSYVHMAVLGALGLQLMMGKGVEFERRALEDPVLYGKMLMVLGIAVVLARWRAVALAKSEEAIVQFEDLAAPAIQPLGLYRDGVLPT